MTAEDRELVQCRRCGKTDDTQDPCATCYATIYRTDSQQKACPWGGCRGTGPAGGRCGKCGTAVDFPYVGRGMQ